MLVVISKNINPIQMCGFCGKKTVFQMDPRSHQFYCTECKQITPQPQDVNDPQPEQGSHWPQEVGYF